MRGATEGARSRMIRHARPQGHSRVTTRGVVIRPRKSAPRSHTNKNSRRVRVDYVDELEHGAPVGRVRRELVRRDARDQALGAGQARVSSGRWWGMVGSCPSLRATSLAQGGVERARDLGAEALQHACVVVGFLGERA